MGLEPFTLTHLPLSSSIWLIVTAVPIKEPEKKHSKANLTKAGKAARREYVGKLISDALRPFDSLPIISIRNLSEAWPGEYQVPKLTPEGPRKEKLKDFPSLADLALRPAVEQVLLTGNVDQLGPFLLIPSKAVNIMEILRSQSNPIPETGIPLLAKILDLEPQCKETFNLSNLILSDQQFFELLSRRMDTEVLKHSHNCELTIAGVETLLVTLSRLRRSVV